MKHWARIRTGSLSFLLVGLVIAFTATPALAVTPTFTVAPPTGENTNGNLTMTFTGVGLTVADGADSALLHKQGGGQADITDGGTFVPGAGTATAHFNLTGAVTGLYDVKVHNSSGYGVCTGCFTVTATNPSIDHADPNAVGQGATGVTVHIIGSNFQSGALVTFGGSGITKDSTTFINSGEIDVLLHVSSSAPTGTVSITILNPDGGTSSCASCFKVNPKPSIISASPSPAPNTAGTTLTLSGSNFETDGTATLSKTGQADITGSNWTDNNPGTNPGDNTSLSIDFPITNAAPGTWVLTIFNIDGGSATCSCVTISASTPTVTSTSPASLPRGSTAVDVTVVGTSFAHGAVASFSDSDITVNSTTWVDATHVKANVTIPSGAAVQSSDVTVTNTDGNSGHCTGCFSVTLLAPVVSSVSPTSGHEGQTLNVTVIGNNFVSTPTVTFTGGGITENSTSFVDASHVTVNITIDPAADVSARDVTLQNPDGQSYTCTACFNVILPAPTATSATPSTGHRGTTLDVTVNGSNFVSGATVTFPGSADITVNLTTFVNSGHLTANITIDPAATLSARNIKVTNPDTQNVTCSGCFTIILPTPTATSVTPSMGEQGSTIDVVIGGTNFVSGAAASFPGSPDITVNLTTFVDSTHVKANITIGSGAATTARDATVTNPDSQSATCSGCFTVVAKTTTTFTTPSTLTAPVVATFSQDVGGVTTSNFVFGVTGSGTTLAGTVACKNASMVATSCAGSTVRSAWLTPTARLVPGQRYTATVNPTSAPSSIVDGAGAPVTSASVAFRGSLVQEETSLAASYLWRAVTNSHALGGTYTTEHLAGATASYTFSGTAVRWYTMLGPNQGTAHVYVDGGSFGRVNNYRSTTVFGAYWTFSGLAPGTHTLLIVVDGLKGSTNGTGTLITVDGMKPGTGAVQSNPSIAYNWRNASYSAASGGHYAQADLAGTSAFFTFRGTRLDWYTVFGQYNGKASVYIDGTLRATVDTYRSSTVTGRFIFTGLSDATHVIRIIVTGTKSAASRGTNIIIDRFDVF